MSDLPLRAAHAADIPALQRLIEHSVRTLSVGHYTDAQIASGIRYVFGVDTQLVADGTYFLVEGRDGPVASGGWSGRATLYGGDQHKTSPDVMLDPRTDPARIRAFFVHPDWARRGLGRRLFAACLEATRAAGFRSLELASTLPGLPLYLALGFTPHERIDATLPDGVVLPVVRMTRGMEPASGATRPLAPGDRS